MPVLDMNKVVRDYETIRDQYNRVELFELVRLILARLEYVTIEKKE